MDHRGSKTWCKLGTNLLLQWKSLFSAHNSEKETGRTGRVSRSCRLRLLLPFSCLQYLLFGLSFLAGVLPQFGFLSRVPSSVIGSTSDSEFAVGQPLPGVEWTYNSLELLSLLPFYGLGIMIYCYFANLRLLVRFELEILAPT